VYTSSQSNPLNVFTRIRKLQNILLTKLNDFTVREISLFQEHSLYISFKILCNLYQFISMVVSVEYLV